MEPGHTPNIFILDPVGVQTNIILCNKNISPKEAGWAPLISAYGNRVGITNLHLEQWCTPKTSPYSTTVGPPIPSYRTRWL